MLRVHIIKNDLVAAGIILGVSTTLNDSFRKNHYAVKDEVFLFAKHDEGPLDERDYSIDAVAFRMLCSQSDTPFAFKRFLVFLSEAHLLITMAWNSWKPSVSTFRLTHR